MNVIYTISSVILVSLISVIISLPFLIKKKISNKTLLFLLSFSIGVLLGAVFLSLIPEVIEHEYTHWSAIILILGFLVMLIVEKFVHRHHSKECENGDCGHSHAYHLAPVNLLGDGIHNFIDGLIIAGSYSVNLTLGLTTTISVIFHEVPQEIADLGVLLYSGLSKKKAILFNFLSASTAIIGAIIGLILTTKIHGFSEIILPFAAGNFIYIAASNLTPQLHRHCKLKDTLLHFLAIILGVAIIFLTIHFGPAHSH